ncbi:hypothetical protein GCM10028801_30270 [Nocardioides maradonensis]
MAEGLPGEDVPLAWDRVEPGIERHGWLCYLDEELAGVGEFNFCLDPSVELLESPQFDAIEHIYGIDSVGYCPSTDSEVVLRWLGEAC